MARYDYSGPYKSPERAQSALEDMFATGDVREGERPQIERRGGKTRTDARARYSWWITLA